MAPREQCARQMERMEHPRIVCPVCTKARDTRNPSKALVVGIMVRGNRCPELGPPEPEYHS